ncbi:ATP-binding protein [Kutzneria albida]|uniref:histidine kinase n=1 Tax=Kutzneria albida DSM 43870 TaxID=1449976 RepID=W5WAG5_9PSEU|nr:ATP-binding protein [Kutzneria albida]AHH97937.1 hypothetical protein KALB_4575 [Kutzneria albida DSM 43870]
MTGQTLLALQLHEDSDVFLLRQRGREVARAAGLDAQDQIRVATALSDLGRILLGGSSEVTATFRLSADRPAALDVELVWPGERVCPELPGWAAATRLLDEVVPSARAEFQVLTLRKKLPMDSLPPTVPQLERLRAELSELRPASALDELRAQNQDLLVTLDNLERKQRELVRLNEELEETNRGVLALYSELSSELDQTNQGVLALYAELDQKSRELTQASEAKTRFWSSVSHELRTPVNSVVGLARLLLGPGGDPLGPEQHRQLSLINRSAENLLALIGQLLDVAKAESGRLEVKAAPVDLRLVFAGLHDTLRPTSAHSAVALRVEPPADPACLVTDETMLVHVLRNLLSNGLKFTERGEVRLTAEPEPDTGWWRFTVSDTGIGIPSDQEHLVFEEFHQVPNPLQARSAGTGLGLPYARRLAEVLGGELTLSSTVGAGTEVVLRLPAEVSPEPGVGTVLLVVDDDTLRTRLRHLIVPLAQRVLEAGDVESALVATRQAHPDVVVFEEAEGWQRLSAWREGELAVVPAVVLTAADAVEAPTAPLVTVLHKSRLSPDTVGEALRRALGLLVDRS